MTWPRWLRRAVKTSYVEYNGAQISYKEFEYSRDQRWAALYLVFGWFWTSEFIFALSKPLSCVKKGPV